MDLLKNIKNININTIISFLTSPEIQEKLFPAKIVFLVISGLFLGFIIFALLRTHYLEWLFFQPSVEFFTYRPFGAKKINRAWNKIFRRLETGIESEYKLAIIEADNMLDFTLTKMGYPGQTLEERLGKLTKTTLPNIEQIYEAHKVRNNIVHDPDYRLSLDEAKKTLNVYGKAFQDLQILT